MEAPISAFMQVPRPSHTATPDLRTRPSHEPPRSFFSSLVKSRLVWLDGPALRHRLVPTARPSHTNARWDESAVEKLSARPTSISADATSTCLRFETTFENGQYRLLSERARPE